MREILISEECIEFIEKQDRRVREKFSYLIEMARELKSIDSRFVKKLENTPFYEMRIRASNEFRVIIYSIDSLNFNKCTLAICLHGFQKKSTKDYKKAINRAHTILDKYDI